MVCAMYVFRHGLHDTRGEYTEVDRIAVSPGSTFRVETGTATEGTALHIVITTLSLPNDDAASSVRHLRHCFARGRSSDPLCFGPVLTISLAMPTPHARIHACRACTLSCSRLLDADWCSQSDGVANP